MDIYLVGGAVRDGLLGRPVSERDWVVVGSTPDALEALGFRRVGRDFPVFLHPETAEEYALARTERKTGPGHTGFVCHAGPEVTLEEDLERRDLTVNTIARQDDGTLIDPFGGRADLEARVLRHVSAAFCEDPLRVFRVARFAAQLPGFRVAPETLELMARMARENQLAELAAERVWQELYKALGCAAPARFFEVLGDAGALEPWLAELSGVAVAFPDELADPDRRFGALAWALERRAADALCRRLKAPKRLARLADCVAAHGRRLATWRQLTPEELLEIFRHIGALSNRPDHGPVVDAVAALSGSDLAPLTALIEAVRGVDSAPFRARGLTGPAIGEAMRAAQLELIADRLRAA